MKKIIMLPYFLFLFFIPVFFASGQTIFHEYDLDNSTKLQDLTYEEFKNNEIIQKIIYKRALKTVEKQDKFMTKIVNNTNKKDNKFNIISFTKRDDFNKFIDGILEKGRRKKYTFISQMDDIVRGRVNVKNGFIVRRIIDEIKKQKEFSIKEIVPPRNPIVFTIGDRQVKGFTYPRFHVVLQDDETGLSYEWQIGTQAVTDILETPQVPLTFHTTKFNPDIHDLNYDILMQMKEKTPEIYKKYEPLIRAFQKKLNILMAKAGIYGDLFPVYQSTRQEVFEDAGDLINTIYHEEGLAFLEGFSHAL